MEISVEKKYIGTWGIVAITLASIANAIGLALMSSAGYSSLLIFLVAGFLFYIPSVLVCTELATSFPSATGVYDWVTRAFGPKFGALVVWCQNVGPIVSMPALVGFSISCLAFGIDEPWLAMNKLYIIFGCLIVVWVMVGINLTGIKSSFKAAAICAFCNYLIPVVLFSIFAVYWLFSGHHLATPVTTENFFASSDPFANMSLLVVAIFMLSGIGQPAYFANLVKKPSIYIKAMIISSVILLVAPLIACAAILFVLPVHGLNDQTGVMQAFGIYFSSAFGAQAGVWFYRLLMWMFFIGQMCAIATVFLIASRGMMALAISGMLPKKMAKANKRNVSTRSMVWLGIISSVIILLYSLIPSLTTAFAIVTVVFSIAGAAQYLLLFAAYVKLKKMKLKVPAGAYQIHNKLVAYLYCVVLGSLCILIAIISSFIPSTDIAGMSVFEYETIVVIGCLVMFLTPYAVFKLKRKRV